MLPNVVEMVSNIHQVVCLLLFFAADATVVLRFCISCAKGSRVALVGERSDLPGHEGQVATHLSLGQGRPGGTVEIPM